MMRHANSFCPKASSRTVVTFLIVLAVVLAAPGPAEGEEPEKREDVKDIGLTEQAATSLVQIDVTVTGPPDRITALGREDFELRVNNEFIEDFLVDKVCRTIEVGKKVKKPDAPAAPTGAPPAPAPAASPITYFFYFDQPHLTMSGRVNALEIARELVRELVTEDARAMIVSAAGDLKVVAEMTSDPEVLLAALDDLEEDRKQWDTFSALEDTRTEEILFYLRENVTDALTVARRYQREEVWQAERSLHRISMVMGRMVDVDPPKAFLYFADTMRSNPGMHYLGYFGNALLYEKREGGGQPMIDNMEASAGFTGQSFQRILDEATALGVRFYTVQAQGMVTPDVTARKPGSSAARGNMGTAAGGLQSATPANLYRVRHAQDTLGSMAAETGGQAFLNGIPAKKIARRMQEDLSCVYLVSFDPGDMPLDEPLPVRISVRVPKVRLHSRGRLVIQSEGVRRTSRLLAAFATSGARKGGHPIQAALLPTGYEDGRYTALVQVTVPGTEVANATWDVGASLVTRGKVREDSSGRIRTATPGVRIVFEQEITLRPGPYELVAVAHELTTDQVFSRRFEGELPDPDLAPVTVVPIAVLQPVRGAILREGELKTAGALAGDDRHPLLADQPTALVGLVCRGKFNKNTLRVERELAGEDAAPFPVLELEPAGDRCAQFRDLVKPGTMTEGSFRYEVRVLEEENETLSIGKEFMVAEPEG